jgi:predicted RNA polymerase sigma factor
MPESLQQIIERVHRNEYGQLLATLIGWLGDLELAEEALQARRSSQQAGCLAYHHSAPQSNRPAAPP